MTEDTNWNLKEPLRLRCSADFFGGRDWRTELHSTQHSTENKTQNKRSEEAVKLAALVSTARGKHLCIVAINDFWYRQWHLLIILSRYANIENFIFLCLIKLRELKKVLRELRSFLF